MLHQGNENYNRILHNWYITPLCCIHCECWFFRINFNLLLRMNWQKNGILRACFNLWDEASDKVHIFCESHIFEEIFPLVLMAISNVQTKISSHSQFTYRSFHSKHQTLNAWILNQGTIGQWNSRTNLTGWRNYKESWAFLRRPHKKN